MNSAVFGKTMENVRRHKGIKLAITEIKTNFSMSEPIYHTAKLFTENLWAREMTKTQVYINKHVYWRLSILKLIKILIYEFWYDYVKPKFGEKVNLGYMDTGGFIVYIKAHLYQDIAENIETCFDTSNYELDKPLPTGKNKKVIGLIKDKLGGEITTKFAGLRTKTYSSLIDDSSEDKKSNSTKRSVIKRKLKFQNYKNFLEGTHLNIEIKHLQKKIKLT